MAKGAQDRLASLRKSALVRDDSGPFRVYRDDAGGDLHDLPKTPMIAVWFSCGAASAVAAKQTLERYGSSHQVRVINNPVLEEDDDNRRFLRDVEQWLGTSIETATNPKYPEASAVKVWDDRRFMSGPLGAPCTIELKKHARQEWEKRNNPDWHVLGFTADEINRYKRFVETERDNVLPVLIDSNTTKAMCFEILRKEGIDLPRIYKMGYPNANCIGCVKATSPTYWNHVREQHPHIFEQRAIQSREIGARLVRVKNKRLFLDELDPKAKGRPMKTLQYDCGIFCEEQP